MQHIDRLIIKAKTTIPQDAVRLVWAFISCGGEGGKWFSQAYLSGGKYGPEGRTIYGCHATEEIAVHAVRSIAEIYPPESDLHIIINDIPRPKEGDSYGGEPETAENEQPQGDKADDKPDQ